MAGSNTTIPSDRWGDPAFRVVAIELDLAFPADAVGRYYHLIKDCVDKKTDAPTRKRVEMVMGAGAAEALIAAELAQDLGDGRVLLPEASPLVEKWARYLVDKEEAGVERAKQAKEAGARDDNGRYNTSSRPPAASEQKASSAPARDQQKPASDQLSVSGSLSVSESKQKPPKPPKGGSPRARSKTGITELDRAAAKAVLAKLTARTKTPYRVSDQHTALIIARFRDGLDEVDLRKVIGYAASSAKEGGLGWQEDERMRHFLRPETLFGPKTIEKYIDAARSWFTQHVAEEPEPSPEFTAWRAAESAPLLQVVR